MKLYVRFVVNKLRNMLWYWSEKCCKNTKLENDNGEYVRKHCGQFVSYDTVDEIVDFYDNRHKIIRKSAYHPKSHIQKSYNKQISTNDKNKILEIFEKIKSVLDLEPNILPYSPHIRSIRTYYFFA